MEVGIWLIKAVGYHNDATIEFIVGTLHRTKHFLSFAFTSKMNKIPKIKTNGIFVKNT